MESIFGYLLMGFGLAMFKFGTGYWDTVGAVLIIVGLGIIIRAEIDKAKQEIREEIEEIRDELQDDELQD